MEILALSIATVIAALCIHFIWWRLYPPYRPKQKLFILFVGVLLLAGVYYSTLPAADVFGIISLALFVLGFAGSYLISYTLIETDGPTFIILLAIDRWCKRGIKEEELSAIVTDEYFVAHRLNELIFSSHVESRDDKLFLTPAGKKSLQFYRVPRRILGLKQLGG